MDNTLTSTKVKLIGEGFKLEIKRGETINFKLKACSGCLNGEASRVNIMLDG
jgi:hypothetical protein